jgi:hypothetical protein
VRGGGGMHVASKPAASDEVARRALHVVGNRGAESAAGGSEAEARRG